MGVKLLYIARDTSKAVLLLRVPIDSDISLYTTTCKRQSKQSQGQHGMDHSREAEERLFCPCKCLFLTTVYSVDLQNMIIQVQGAAQAYFNPCNTKLAPIGLQVYAQRSKGTSSAHK